MYICWIRTLTLRVVEMAQMQSIEIIVASIDCGTTHSDYAYSFKDDYKDNPTRSKVTKLIYIS